MSSARSPANRGKAGSKPPEAGPAVPARGVAVAAGRATPAPIAPPTVRLARLGDLGDLVELEERCFPPEDRFPRASWRRLLGPAASNGSAISLVIEGAGLAAAIVGLMRRGGRTARIYSLAVDPACRGRGLANLLMAALARRMRQRGCRWLSLEVREENQAALGLYGKLGFSLYRHLPKYYAGIAHGVRLRGDIDAVLEKASARSDRRAMGPNPG
jgi:ribosomal-protein-alanine N-acetyltransferase